MKVKPSVAVFIITVTVTLGVAGGYPEVGRPRIVESFSIGSHAQAYGESYDSRQFNIQVFNASKDSAGFSAPLKVPRHNYRPYPTHNDLSSQYYHTRSPRQDMQNVYLPPNSYLPAAGPFDQTGIQNSGLLPPYTSGYSGPSNMPSPQGRFLDVFTGFPNSNKSPFGKNNAYSNNRIPSVNGFREDRQRGGFPNRFNPTNNGNAPSYPSSPPRPDFGPPGVGQSFSPPGNAQFAGPSGQPYPTPGNAQFASPPGQTFPPPGNSQFSGPPGQPFPTPSVGQFDSPLGQPFPRPGNAQFASPLGQSFPPPGNAQFAGPPGQSFPPPGVGQFANPPGQGPAVGQPPLGVGPATFPGRFPPILSLLNSDPLVPAGQSIVQFTSSPDNSEYFFSYIVADPVTFTYFRYQELRSGGVVNGFYIVIHPDTHVQTTVFEADGNGARKATSLKRYKRADNFTPDDA